MNLVKHPTKKTFFINNSYMYRKEIKEVKIGKSFELCGEIFVIAKPGKSNYSGYHYTTGLSIPGAYAKTQQECLEKTHSSLESAGKNKLLLALKSIRKDQILNN